MRKSSINFRSIKTEKEDMNSDTAEKTSWYHKVKFNLIPIPNSHMLAIQIQSYFRESKAPLIEFQKSITESLIVGLGLST